MSSHSPRSRRPKFHDFDGAGYADAVPLAITAAAAAACDSTLRRVGD
jgi:hypothetical protein